MSCVTADEYLSPSLLCVVSLLSTRSLERRERGSKSPAVKAQDQRGYGSEQPRMASDQRNSELGSEQQPDLAGRQVLVRGTAPSSSTARKAQRNRNPEPSEEGLHDLTSNV